MTDNEVAPPGEYDKAIAFLRSWVEDRDDDWEHNDTEDAELSAAADTLEALGGNDLDCSKCSPYFASDPDQVTVKREYKIVASPAATLSFIDWLACQPCTGNGSGTLCRENAPGEPQWQCSQCRAFELRYGQQKGLP